MKKFLLLISMLLFAVISSWATTWYVSPSGSDVTGDGSSGNPWQTIQKAIDQSIASDVIQLTAGTFVVSSQINVNKANLTIQGVNNTSTKIQVSGTSNSQTGLIYISVSGITIQDIEFNVV